MKPGASLNKVIMSSVNNFPSFQHKPLSELMMTNSLLDPQEKKPWNFKQTSWNRHIDGLVQGCSNYIANALELLQSCTKPSHFKMLFAMLRVRLRKLVAEKVQEMERLLSVWNSYVARDNGHCENIVYILGGYWISSSDKRGYCIALKHKHGYFLKLILWCCILMELRLSCTNPLMCVTYVHDE